MYKLMIVDDEFLSRFVVKSLIQKKFKNIEIVAEPENGRQAIEYSLRCKPDIIIMDIKMPGLNGIEASRVILNEFPDTKILILTAYDNFNYVKEALDLGIKGFLLKPINEEEVIQSIQKLINEMQKQKRHSDQDDTMEEKMRTVRPLIENELVSAFITGEVDDKKIESYRELLKENDFNSGFFMLITPAYHYLRKVDREISFKGIREKIFEAVSNHPLVLNKCLFGNKMGSTIVVFHTMKKDHSDIVLIREVLAIGNELTKRIQTLAKIDTAIGIGNVYGGFGNLCKSYHEANLALKRALKTGGVVHYNKIQADTIPYANIEYPMEFETLIVEQLKLGKTESAKETACEFIYHVMSNNGNIEVVKESLSVFITVLKRTVVNSGTTFNQYCKSNMVMELGNLKEQEEIAVWSKRCMFNLIEHIQNKDDITSKLIGRVIDYINKHFSNEITLNQIADEVGLSPQYLSKIFKENYGTNFIDYITKKRIEHAEELLVSSGKSIKEISGLVGYEDPNYFSRIFKKDTGCTPRQFRLQKAMGESG